MNVVLEEFDINNYHHNKNYMVIGISGSGRSTLLKKMLDRTKYKQGSVITDSFHFHNFYNFLHPACLYKKYSPLLKYRCFRREAILFMDNSPYEKYQLHDLCKNIDATDNFDFIAAYDHCLDLIKFDYLIIISTLPDEALRDIYKKSLLARN